MKKISLSIFLACAFLAVTVSAQTSPLQITNGKFSIFSGEASQIESSSFAATGSIQEHSESVWYNICGGGSFCRGGTTFTLPFSTRIGENIGTLLPFSSGSFSVNGVNYPNAYYSGRLNFADSAQSETLRVHDTENFNLRRKGTYRIKRPFELLPSDFKVCEVSMLNAPCPPEKILFDGQIQGHGTITITLRYLNNIPQMPQLIRKSFEYQFEQ